MPKKSATTTKQTVKAPKKGYLDRIEEEVNTNQSKLNLILGALIVLVIGVLVFNYFNRNKASDTQSQKTENQGQQQDGDVSLEKLPGKYTIKEGDTLFSVAEKYYNDGYKYPELVKANNLTNPDSIEVGQTINIPKLEIAATATPTSTQADSTPTASPTPTVTPQPQASSPTDTEWGPKITGDKYTVMPGDWLSKIAARAYGDTMQYEKISKANNISNPDLIEPGTVLTIPR